LDIKFTIAEFGSSLHQQSIVLRDQLLRKPLGLRFNDLELAEEIDQFHLVATVDDIVVGVTLLKVIDQGCTKIRQFAVNDNLQGQGIGKKLLYFAESIAQEKGFTHVELHARKSAADFYEKYKYQIVGDPFEEVGMPHFRMVKSL